MELPFLKNKNRHNLGSNSVPIERTPDESGDDAIMKHITSEFITATKKGDLQTLIEALKALVITIRSKDASNKE